jgi:8-oxo-dGTP pyrophosphatase MutT (NUDIX family)
MVRSGDKGKVHDEACAVPYRIRDKRLEFCLVSAQRTSRWEFPHTTIAAGESPLQAACRCVLETTGLVCHPTNQEPLDDVRATQNQRLVKLTAFLLEVQPVETTDTGHRIKWCFAEEARARIRRKPMRRLIDLALRRQTGQ